MYCQLPMCMETHTFWTSSVCFMTCYVLWPSPYYRCGSQSDGPLALRLDGLRPLALTWLLCVRGLLTSFILGTFSHAARHRAWKGKHQSTVPCQGFRSEERMCAAAGGTDSACLMAPGRSVSMKPTGEISQAKGGYWELLNMAVYCCPFCSSWKIQTCRL